MGAEASQRDEIEILRVRVGNITVIVRDMKSSQTKSQAVRCRFFLETNFSSKEKELSITFCVASAYSCRTERHHFI